MKNSNLKEILIPTVALTVILTIVVTALIFTYNATKPAEKSADSPFYDQELYKSIYPDSKTFSKIKFEGDESVREVVKADKGYIISVAKKGYSSDPLVAMVGVSKSNQIDKVVIAETKETVGLGDKVGKDKFLSNFNGKNGPFVLKDNVDAVAGATRSSRAVTEAVNVALETFEKVNGGQG